MTNYQKIMQDMDFDKLVWMLALNCDACPCENCPLRGGTREYCECEDVLTEWLNQSAT